MRAAMFQNAPLPLNVALFVAAAAVVWMAAIRLTHAADEIATRTGLGQELVGLLLLGGVTSLPELAVAISATAQGTPALTIADVLGSAALNVIILAIADATIRRQALTSVQGSPKVLLIGVLGTIMLAIVVAPTITGDALLWGMGRWSWVMLLAYAAAVWLMAHSQAERAWRPLVAGAAAAAGTDEEAAAPQASPARLAGRAAAAAALILVAGFVLSRAGEAVARQSGLGTAFFGMVFLALATSLPEISTVLAAVRRRRYEMAISDVFGTNLFNVTIIVLVDALHPGGPVLVETGRFASFGALLALVLTGLYLMGLVERRDRTLAGLGIDSVLALVTYGAGLVVLYSLR